jgi:hypothetical protein
MKKTTKFQMQIAAKLGIAIQAESFDVAAAQIWDEIEEAITVKRSDRSPTKRQIEFAASLGLDVSKDTRRVASARIGNKLDEINHKLIQEFGLKPGIFVRWKKWNRTMEISSIAENGRLWFKGGNGWGAFPSEIEVIKASEQQL